MTAATASRSRPQLQPKPIGFPTPPPAPVPPLPHTTPAPTPPFPGPAISIWPHCHAHEPSSPTRRTPSPTWPPPGRQCCSGQGDAWASQGKPAPCVTCVIASTRVTKHSECAVSLGGATIGALTDVWKPPLNLRSSKGLKSILERPRTTCTTKGSCTHRVHNAQGTLLFLGLAW